MRRVWAVMSRELRAYFDSIIAYVILLAFFSLTTWNTLESLDEGSQASLRPFFDFLPLGFLFFIPALAMRLWAEERRLGTIELLMTWPLRTWDVVLGKFLAGLTLIVVALLMTSSYAVYIMNYGEPDIGPLIGGYVAALLLGGAYLALGCFISSLTEHQIVAYVLSVFCAAAFFLVGHPDTLASMPQNKEIFGHVFDLEPTIEFMAAIGFGSRFSSIGRGVLDLGDLAFYVAIIVAFLYLNVRAVAWQSVKGETSSPVVTTVLILSFFSLASFFAGVYWLAIIAGIALLAFVLSIQSKMSTIGINRLLDNTVAAILAFIIALQLSLLVDRVNWRSDLTEEKAYSLSPLSLNIAKELEDPLEIRCYFSGSLPQVLNERRQQVEDTLSEFVTASNGQISILYFDPDADNIAKERATREGIQAQKVNIKGGKDSRSIERFFGCVLEYQGQKELFQFMPPPNQLESQFAAALRNLTTARQWTVGLLSSEKQLTTGYQSIYRALKQRRLNVTRLKIEGLKQGLEIPKNVNVLILMKPMKMTEREAYEIDQFVMRGGTLLLLADGVVFDSSFRVKPVVTGLENVLSSYGFEIPKQVIRDNDRSKLLVISVNDGKTKKSGPNPFAVQVKKSFLNDSHPVTKHLSQLSFNEASPVVVLDKKMKVTELVKSAPSTFSSARLGGMGRVLLNFIEGKEGTPASPNPSRGEIRQPLLAVAYEGPLTSFFQGRRPPKPSDSNQESLKDTRRETKGEIEKGRLIIVGDSAFYEQQRWNGYTGADLVSAVNSGGQLVLNSIDWIVNDEDLIELRNRGLKDRRMSFPKDSSENQRIAFVYLLTPFILCLLGIGRWFYLYQRGESLEAQLRRIIEAHPVSWEPRERPQKQEEVVEMAPPTPMKKTVIESSDAFDKVGLEDDAESTEDPETETETGNDKTESGQSGQQKKKKKRKRKKK